MNDGSGVGCGDGADVGDGTGTGVGGKDGADVGSSDGRLVGTGVGAGVGADSERTAQKRASWISATKVLSLEPSRSPRYDGRYEPFMKFASTMAYQ